MAGIWSRLFRGPVTETRSSFQVFGENSLQAGIPVNAALAENLATVCACVGAVSSGLASLPAYVYRRDGASRVEAPTHPVSRLIRQPNPRQTWPDFIEWLISSALLHGNALAAIEYDGAGRPVALLPVPWNAVQPIMLPSGRLAFDVVTHRTVGGGAGMPRRYLAGEVLHLKDRTDDSWLGRSRISRAAGVMSAAIGLQTYSAALWDNAATPSGIVTLPPNVTRAQKDAIEAYLFARNQGANNAKNVLFVDRDTTWQSVSVSPEDAEVLASRRFSGEELARVFGVPPPIIGDLSHGTFTNSETAGRWFAQFTLAPWARKIEAEFARSVFGDGAAHLEIDLSGLMRGDYAARWTANVAAVQAGILLPNEVRDAEGYNPLPAVVA